MADVEVQMQFSTEKRVRKVKKTTTSKRRESSDQGEVTITEIEKENQLPNNTDEKGYVASENVKKKEKRKFCISSPFPTRKLVVFLSFFFWKSKK